MEQAEKTASPLVQFILHRKKWWIPPIVLAAALIGAVFLTGKGSTNDDRYQRANQAIARQDWQQAVDLLTSFIGDAARNTGGGDIFPLAEAYDLRGKVFCAQGDFDKALADCTKAITLRPRHSAFYVNRGQTYRFARRDDLAVEDFSKAIDLEPDNPTAYGFRGKLYLDDNHPDKAIADFDSSLRLNPSDAVACLNRGTAHAKLHHNAEAIADFTEAIKHQPDYAEAYNNRAVLYYTTGQTEMARLDASRCRDCGGTPSPGLVQALLSKNTASGAAAP